VVPSSGMEAATGSGGVGRGGVAFVDGGFDVRDLNVNFFFGSSLSFSVINRSLSCFNCYR
jgi:hypothetical protein